MGYRVSEAREAIQELERLARKPVEAMTGDERYSMRYNLIVVVEAIVAAALAYLRLRGLEPPESYTEVLARAAIDLGMPGNCIDELVALARPRNLLVHRYRVINDAKIDHAIREDFRCIHAFLEELEKTPGANDEPDTLLQGRPR